MSVAASIQTRLGTGVSARYGIPQLVEARVDRGHRDVDILLQVGDYIRLLALDVSPVQRDEIPRAVTGAQTLITAGVIEPGIEAPSPPPRVVEQDW